MPKFKICMTVTIETELFKEIEKLRGREKRSTFVEHILRLGLERFKLKKSLKPLERLQSIEKL